MGNSQANNKSFLTNDQDLTFYIDIEDPLMGNIPIYTSKKMPLCYIMKISSEIVDSKIYNLFQRIQNAQVPALVSLYGYQMKRHKYCDRIIKETVTSYWEYYNFYFYDYLKKRAVKGCPMMEAQIWHLVQICCEGAAILKKYNCFYDFSPKTMVVTPQGKLKLCWWHLLSQNKHLRYFKYFENYEIDEFFYSPEELQLMKNRQLTTKLNFDKCNSFGFGMLLLQTICLINPINSCYCDNFSKVSFKMIKNLINTKVVPNYNQEIVEMLNLLLQKDPKDRISMAKVYQKYKEFLNDQNQLRVCGAKKDKQDRFQKYQKYEKRQKSQTKSVFRFQNSQKKQEKIQDLQESQCQKEGRRHIRTVHQSLNNKNANINMNPSLEHQSFRSPTPNFSNSQYRINNQNNRGILNNQSRHFIQSPHQAQPLNTPISINNNQLSQQFKPNSPDFSDAKTVKNYKSSRKNIGSFYQNLNEIR